MLFDFTADIARCAPQVAPVTMLAIIQTESKGNPLAIGLNGGHKLRYPAKTLKQARAWVDYLELHNYNFDIGLLQINIKNVHKYGYRARDMLDSCNSLRVASRLLQQNYHKALNLSNKKSDALLMALSAYNTGDFKYGFSNGYVSTVMASAKSISVK